MDQSGNSARSAPRRTVRVVLADDECMFRTSLRHLLAAPASVVRDVYGVDAGADFDVVGEAGTGEDTVAIVDSVRPDLLLLDLAMPRLTGLEALRAVRVAHRSMRVIVLAGEVTKADLAAAVQLGVRGLVMKNAATELLFQAIASVLAGQPWVSPTLLGDLLDLVGTPAMAPAADADTRRPSRLTRRERQVLGLVVAGYANKDIARTFSVSEETIKHHLTRMFDKVGAANRLELAMFATERGLVSDPDVR